MFLRIFFSLGVFSLSLLSGVFCLAQQETTIDGTWSKTIELELMENESVKKSISDVNQIKTYFCNSEELSDFVFLSVVPGEEKDLCIRFENNNDDKIIISSEFYNTAITAGWTPVCNSGDPINLFTKSIVNDRWNQTQVPAKSYVQKTIKLKFPIWYSGLYHFCHYYKITGWWGNIPMFNIVVHKQNFIDMFINTDNVKLSGSVKLSNFARDKDVISFSLKNTFPFDQEVSFYATISNFLWFKKELVLSGDLVWYNATRDFIVNISDLPYYKWPFNLDIKISYKPHFDFDVKNSGIDNNILNGWEMNQKISFFIFDRVQLMILAVLIILIFLVKMAFFTKAKVVYVEKEISNQDQSKTL